MDDVRWLVAFAVVGAGVSIAVHLLMQGRPPTVPAPLRLVPHGVFVDPAQATVASITVRLGWRKGRYTQLVADAEKLEFSLRQPVAGWVACARQDIDRLQIGRGPYPRVTLIGPTGEIRRAAIRLLGDQKAAIARLDELGWLHRSESV